MKTIKDLCNEIATELGITPVHRWVNIENRLEMSDIMPRAAWEESGVTCLASRPLMGKSSLAEGILIDAAMWMPKPVVYFALETREKKLVHRLIKKICGVDCQWIIKPEELGKVAAALDFLADLFIKYDKLGDKLSIDTIDSFLAERRKAWAI